MRLDPEQHDRSLPEGAQPDDEPVETEHPDEYVGQKTSHYEYILELALSIQQYLMLERYVRRYHTTIPCLFKRVCKLMLDLLAFEETPGAVIILRQPGKPDRELTFIP
jgi:hypothetical protein